MLCHDIQRSRPRKIHWPLPESAYTSVGQINMVWLSHPSYAFPHVKYSRPYTNAESTCLPCSQGVQLISLVTYVKINVFFFQIPSGISDLKEINFA